MAAYQYALSQVRYIFIFEQVWIIIIFFLIRLNFMAQQVFFFDYIFTKWK